MADLVKSEKTSEQLVVEAAVELLADYMSDSDMDIVDRDAWCKFYDRVEEHLGGEVFLEMEIDACKARKLAENGP